MKVNKRQKEVAEVNLKAEQQVLRNLKAVYKKAANDCAEKAKSLLGEGEVTQSKIYQAKYQQALEKQLNVILGKLNKNSYSTISEYLEDCYNNGFIGAMYDIAGQGIPVISPINQKQIVQAVQLNSKISEGLYKRMGKDTVKLKKQIKAQISRGISNGSSYTEIARNINLKADIGYNNSVRIARTEGHRIQIDSAMDAQYAAKEEGADIVKQWDSTLDGDTRPHHRQLDGQIREITDDFEINGRKVSAPGHFNDPSEDCNCRCALLQRARWALDEDEIEELKKHAEYFGLDKTKDFADFKAKYLSAADEVDKSTKSSIMKLKIKTDNALSTIDKENIKNISEILNSAPEDIKKAFNACESFFEINPHYTLGDSHYNCLSYSVNVDISKMNLDTFEDVGRGKEKFKNAYNELFHEVGHAIDNVGGRNSVGGYISTKLSSVFISPSKGISLGDSLEKEVLQCVQKCSEEGMSKVLKDMPLIESADISDIFGAFTENRVMGYAGHNVNYYANDKKEKAAGEAFAEMFSAEINNLTSMKQFKKYFPESLVIFKEILSAIPNIDIRR